jgi:23S rRNA (cytidine1920-2'-O)/16S rRNA (cytidine1409-2'-O)-methyltransferase
VKKVGAARRLDLLLLEINPGLTRSRAQAEIMAGRVLVDGRVCDKPGTLISPAASVTLLEPENPYVSRGGLKLEGALADLGIEVKGLVVLDAGASTGGFTDCLLAKGAKRVYALDVGYGQLDWRLRNDPRVTVLERFNVRHLKREHLPEAPQLATVDVSFISLKLVLPVLRAAGVPAVLALVKPQFEAGRAEAGRGRGVIRDPGLHRAVLLEAIRSACESGYCCAGLTDSHWPGPRGNLEFFLYGRAGDADCTCPENPEALVDQVVARAHRHTARE